MNLYFFQHLLLVVLIIFAYQGKSFAQNRLTLDQALEQAKISISSKGTGGYQGQCLEIFIENVSQRSIDILIEPGSVFQSEDEDLQDLIVTFPEEINIEPGQRSALKVWTMCTQAWNAGPSRGSGFTYSGMAEPALRRLVNRIAKGNYQNSTAQSAVWVLSSKEPVHSVYGIDTVETRELAEVISQELNIPFSSFNMTPRPHRITQINASLEHIISKKLQQAKLVLIDSDGAVFRQYFEGREIERGFQQFKVGASHTRDSSETFWLTLFNEDEVIYRKKITSQDTILSLQPLHQQAILSYELPQDAEVEIGLYDQDGRLFLDITGLRWLGKGFHRSRTVAQTQVLPDARYFLQARSDGKVLSNQEVFPGEEIPEIFENRLVSGLWRIEISPDIGPGRLALYDQRGQLKRIMAEFTSLRSGTRNFSYSFEHVDGPGAKFTLRLESAEGTILDKYEVVDQ